MTKEERKEYIARYRLEHKDKLKKQVAENYLFHREERIEYVTKYNIEHKEHRKGYKKDYRITHKDEIKEYQLKYRLKHEKKLKEFKKKYNLIHRKETNTYIKQRKLRDPLYKMKCYLRNRTYEVFNKMGLNKPAKTEIILGADYKTVMRHIESQFIFGMTWKNYGEWHIDHKKPLALAKTEKQLIKLCNFKNLQPLWAEDNCRKSNKLNYTTNLI